MRAVFSRWADFFSYLRGRIGKLKLLPVLPRSLAGSGVVLTRLVMAQGVICVTSGEKRGCALVMRTFLETCAVVATGLDDKKWRDRAVLSLAGLGHGEAPPSAISFVPSPSLSHSLLEFLFSSHEVRSFQSFTTSLLKTSRYDPPSSCLLALHQTENLVRDKQARRHDR
jgi:hypothetical protein